MFHFGMFAVEVGLTVLVQLASFAQTDVSHTTASAASIIILIFSFIVLVLSFLLKLLVLLCL